MIIMALDHVRDYTNRAAMLHRPEELAYATAAIFLTRWITHFCAPVFMLTAGLGASLWKQRGRSSAQLSRFLWTRGLWLIFLEWTAVRFVMFFNFDGAAILTVFWVLGWCMIALAALLYLPLRVLASISVAMIALHNLLDGIRASSLGAAAWVWNFLHQSGAFMVGGFVIVIGYPLIPWVAVMAVGYCLGQVFTWEAARRQRFLVRLGAGMTLAFVVLRAVNVYGDPSPWTTQDSAVLSFLNCTKYPPSLAFLLMTLGPAILVLGLIERVRLQAGNPLLVFGRTPLVYFLGHLLLAHLMAVLSALIRYGNVAFLWHPPPNMGGSAKEFPPGYGYDLWVTYLIWITVVAAMYPFCRWFAGLKQRRKDWWLSYL
jgi:uncharacterized membrane protein